MWYPELNKLSTEAVVHGCEREGLVISAYVQIKKTLHIKFKGENCGVFINAEYPGLLVTPDFKRSFDCCGDSCGEVKYPLHIEGCDFEQGDIARW